MYLRGELHVKYGTSYRMPTPFHEDIKIDEFFVFGRYMVNNNKNADMCSLCFGAKIIELIM